MNEIQAREILFHFAIFCKTILNMSHYEFKKIYANLDLAFSSNPEFVITVETYFDWNPKDIIEAYNLQPNVIEHCGYWAFGGGKYGKGN